MVAFDVLYAFACTGWIRQTGFAARGLDDQLLSGLVDLTPTPEEVDVGDSEPAQGSFDPAGFVEGLSVGDLLGGLSCHRLATMPRVDRGEHGSMRHPGSGRGDGCGGSRIGAGLSGVLVQG
jgi:hypothetical protein